MPDIGSIVDLLEYTLNSKTRRHIVGGVLISMSFMFAGFAVTIMTLKPEED